MSIRVKVFASLAEKAGVRNAACDYRAGLTVRDVWTLACRGVELPANALCAVNHEYAKWDTAVADGDEIGFFPPVTGG
jgi:molybdopterin synthase sulfur carrier subunit